MRAGLRLAMVTISVSKVKAGGNMSLNCTGALGLEIVHLPSEEGSRRISRHSYAWQANATTTFKALLPLPQNYSCIN